MKWFMLVYKLPKSKTSATKVSIWRKLKKLGVYPLQDSVCLLPNSERTLENLEWLAEEIKEMGGEATLWLTSSLVKEEEERITEYFLEQTNKQYEEIIKSALDSVSIKHLQSLWTLYNRVKLQDYLKSPLWIEVKGTLERKAQDLTRKGEE
ncbi:MULTISPECIES: Chromate resistance protein ChrB [Desulfosporosinus]|uniref:Chromate resistance protein ChrB n=1 Tax=Desulfosporosinus sp. TaxID=157907 RepID=UPI00230957B2|nr:Chromate resistance protein ChrB [Desulfosporosinus sp.]MCO5385656.1 hypothetical protein [Desulfosporosinus sp.]MDA8222479.1 hypothetical protein [Desulfitobacterium hafniense]